MNVLYLGKHAENIEATIAATDTLTVTESPITTHDFDLIVSYGYRHMLPPSALTVPAFNIHVACLPYNRGADPVLWSVIDGTPAGVTLHLMDAGLDTGDVVARAHVREMPDDTLRTFYHRHAATAELLFCEWWLRLRAGEYPVRPQHGTSTYHRSSDRPYLPLGWDTPLSWIAGTYGRERPARCPQGSDGMGTR